MSVGRISAGTPTLGARTMKVLAGEKGVQPLEVWADAIHTNDCWPAAFRKAYRGREVANVDVLPSEEAVIRTR
ncbi:MAG TPA: hypothetical protein DEV93_05050 [Chloroflexi bacterium]|nr:hypothetical protein [Chloroflexota bacterium]